MCALYALARLCYSFSIIIGVGGGSFSFVLINLRFVCSHFIIGNFIDRQYTHTRDIGINYV